MQNLMLIIVIAAVLGAVVWYLRWEKKRGKTCVGCPYGGCCGKDSCCSRK